MKNTDRKFTYDIFIQFALSEEEMSFVRGGESEDPTKPVPEPVKI